MRIDVVDRGGRAQDDLRAYVGLRLMSELDHFVRRVEVVTVSLTEVAGADATALVRCRMLAQLAPSGQCVAQQIDAGTYAAIDTAAQELARALGRAARPHPSPGETKRGMPPAVARALPAPGSEPGGKSTRPWIDVQARGVEMAEDARRHAERRVLFAIGRFGGWLGAVGVHLDDVNGPRGGIDKRCQISARFLSGGGVRIVEVGPDVYSTIDLAADRLRQAVARQVGRRREKKPPVSAAKG